MDRNSEATRELHQLRIYEVALKTSNTVKHIDVVFFAYKSQREERLEPLESDEEMVPILAVFAHENYPTYTLVGVL